MLIYTITVEDYFYPRSPCGERLRWARSRRRRSADFYPRSPCGERLSRKAAMGKPTLISIHALLAESDGFQGRQQLIGDISIHALLAESDGVLNSLEIRSITISIHALLAESDGPGVGQGPPHHNFYPRSPCGERQRCFCSRLDVINFYPRSPCGERPGRYQIPSHRHPHFYPRSPCGERPLPRSRPGSGFPISIHALLAESDGKRRL